MGEKTLAAVPASQCAHHSFDKLTAQRHDSRTTMTPRFFFGAPSPHKKGSLCGLRRIKTFVISAKRSKLYEKPINRGRCVQSNQPIRLWLCWVWHRRGNATLANGPWGLASDVAARSLACCYRLRIPRGKRRTQALIWFLFSTMREGTFLACFPFSLFFFLDFTFLFLMGSYLRSGQHAPRTNSEQRMSRDATAHKFNPSNQV